MGPSLPVEDEPETEVSDQQLEVLSLFRENASCGPPPPRLPFIYEAPRSPVTKHMESGLEVEEVLFIDKGIHEPKQPAASFVIGDP